MFVRKSRNQCIITGFIVLCAALLSTVPTHAVDIGGETIGVTSDFTYASKYLWHGYDILDDRTAFQPSVTVDYKGFFAGVWGSWPGSSGFEDFTEIDLFAGYGRSFLEEECYAVDAWLSYTYFIYPKINNDADVQELGLGFSMPNLIPLGESALIPHYAMYYDWDGVQSSDKVDNGWFQTFGLSYSFAIPALIPTQESQAIDLSWDITYNDGVFGSDSGWSHSTLGISTTFEWRNLYFTPAVNYQSSFEDSVNDEDELYALFSVGIAF